MMTNKEIAKAFQQLAQFMELHQENPYKIRSYENAYLQLRKLDEPLSELTPEQIAQLPGIGSAITAKIQELLQSGQLEAVESYRSKTPDGIVEMLQINGFGPKKIRSIWKELGVESIGELQYALNENRLLELKGFGEKTQLELQEKITFFQKNSGHYHYRTLEQPATDLLAYASSQLPAHRWEESGALRRKAITLTHISLLTSATAEDIKQLDQLEFVASSAEKTQAIFHGYPVEIYHCEISNWGSKQFKNTGSPSFLAAFLQQFPKQDFTNLAEEQLVFDRAGIPYLSAELRENAHFLHNGQRPQLIQLPDIRGILHCHTTYSDGIHTLAQMAEAARDQGYGYLLVTDHSQSAFYANGLKLDRIEQQWVEINALNEKMAPFRILKGIESDILPDGSLDYPEELLARFDLVIASIHSQLKMDEKKATQRLLKAIQNPHTHILGHPTGRLLLSRSGYPIDHQQIIDACAEHRVAIELNANPMRLDIDWSWIPYAIEKKVPICINPDAHAIGGLLDVHYGVLAARKGGLTVSDCLNCLELPDFLAWWGKA